jgi:hypothetical protein
MSLGIIQRVREQAAGGWQTRCLNSTSSNYLKKSAEILA